LKTFPIGGIHPPENKLTSGSEIQYLAIPTSVSIPVSQHIGTPASIIVNRDEKVKTGQVIAQSKGFVSSNIHSSVSGKVTKIDTIIDTSG
jgi:electron transport complex protein RnfC